MWGAQMHLWHAQTTGMNLGQSHYLASQAPTINLWLETAKSRKFVIQVFIGVTKFSYQVPTSLQVKIKQRGKPLRVFAHKGFAYHSVKLVLLANGKKHEI